MKRCDGTYFCKKCNYSTSRISHWERHILTPKHLYRKEKESKVNILTYSCICGKKYKYSSGLSKHKKKCFMYLKKKNEETESLNNENIALKYEITKLKSAIPNLMDNISEILKSQRELSIKQQEALAIPTTKNIYNNRVSINVYLNENCKDAMNLQEFIANLNVSLDDLTYTKNHGYAKGISNIFVRELKDLEPTQRPIHCSDNKRLKFYVKDKDKWEKDNENKKIDKTIDHLASKQVETIKEWVKKHPTYYDSPEKLMEWHSMVSAVMGGVDEEKKQKNSEIIKKEIGTTVKLSNNLLILNECINK